MTARGILSLATLAVLAVVPPAAEAMGESFYVDIFTRIMIFAIAALSLDLILGYGGMVSFGHAAYLGTGAYAVGILSYYGITNGFVHFGVAALSSAIFALLIGAVSLRTSGIHFIMITMAFSQMIYFFGVSLSEFGGDDGMNITSPSDFGTLLDLSSPMALYYFVFAILALFLVFGLRLVDSRFGIVIRASKANERRTAAIGFPVFRYKLAAFVLSGTMCGIAGALFANLTLFVSPAVMHWSRSGEIMVMVILGGMGSLVGPVLGTALFLLLEDILSGVTEHWQVILGPILVLVVVFAKRGLVGLLLPARR